MTGPFDRVPGIDHDAQLPLPVRERMAQNLSDPSTPEGAELSRTIAGAVDSPGWRQIRRDLLARHEALKGVPNLATRTAMGATLTGTNTWVGGVLGPDGKIYGIPRNATDILRTTLPVPTPFAYSPYFNKM